MIYVEKVKQYEFKERTILVFFLKTSRWVWLADNKLVLSFPFPADSLSNMGDAVAFSLLPLAYFEHTDIRLAPTLTVSPSLQSRVDAICSLWNEWYDGQRRIRITAPMESKPYYNAKRVAAQLFSGGVDSLYTFARNSEEITYLVLFHGADVSASDNETFSKIERQAQDFAKEFGKRLRVFSTNVRFLSRVSWEYMAHVCAMIAPLLACRQLVHRIYVASSYSGIFGNRYPWGSHPRLDPLICSDGIETVHHGFDVKRFEKIVYLSKNPQLLKRVRVCTRASDVDHQVNCGRCEKCYRTAVALKLRGVSGTESLPSSAFSFLSAMQYLENYQLRITSALFWSEILEFLHKRNQLSREESEFVAFLEIKLGKTYQDYIEDFENAPGSFSNIYSCGGRLRNYEKRVGFAKDSLQILHKLQRLHRGKRYRNFLRDMAKWQQTVTGELC
ncbi:MAG: hypothetical protein GF333_00565 [Candidatus Omnitrophica bacterium]|nr:hypothetical protein [Candidatus Omnitrophota bacterium]